MTVFATNEDSFAGPYWDGLDTTTNLFGKEAKTGCHKLFKIDVQKHRNIP